jgi:(2Fe-2S) ferredoxin
VEEAISKKKKLSKKIRDEMNGAVTEAEAKPAAIIRDYNLHVLVCKSSDCKKRGSKSVRKTLKSELRATGILANVRIDTVDCLGLCKHGPNVVVYPEGIWYLGLKGTDIPEVVEQHFKGGAPVERLAANRRPRKAKKTKK